MCVFTLRRGSAAARLLGSRVRNLPIPVAERSKAQVCGLLIAGFAGSNPARGMDACVVCGVQ